MMDPELKSQHEEFVSTGNVGSQSPWETLILSLVTAHLPLLLWATSKQMFAVPGEKQQLFKSCLFEFVLLGLPLTLGLTVLADVPWSAALCFALAVPTALFYRFLTASRSRGKERDSAKGFSKRLLHKVISNPRQLTFVTNYRSGMLLTTVVCILAVDFTAFPRRFAKTETYGFGLMDMGVGAFVFAGGLVSQEARKGLTGSQVGSIRYIKKSLMECVPMLILGLIRLVSVKGSGYHEHVTEYGLHWNFFFTLAFVKVFSSIIFAMISTRWSLPVSIVIALCHEYALVAGLRDWVLTPEEIAPRHSSGLIMANREGLVSVPGYVSLFLAGVALGHKLSNMQHTFEAHLNLLKTLGPVAIFLWTLLTMGQTHLFELPSRRLVNGSFCLWMIAYNLSLLLCYLLLDLVILYTADRFAVPTKKGKKEESPTESDVPMLLNIRVPFMFQAISYNALAYFLLANLLTGGVNFSMNTLVQPACIAVLAVSIYLFICQIVAVTCCIRSWKFKVW